MPSQHYVQHINIDLVPVDELPESEHDCPICHEPYEAVLSAHGPVRVRGETQTQQCRHVFGSTCVEQHIAGGEPRCLRCPICRESWTQPSIPGHHSIAEMPDNFIISSDIMNAHAAVPYHDAPEVVTGSQIVQRNHIPDPQPQESTLSNRGRFHRSLGFLRQMPSEFEIDDWDADITQRVSELETAAESLWAALDEARRRRRNG